MGYPKIPDITCEDIEKIFAEEEEWGIIQPCCMNCQYYYEEYGYHLCTKHEEALYLYKHQKCEDWR